MENKALFINGSPNKDGNTAALAKTLLDGMEYETLNLTDYKVYSYGQTFADDQFDEVLARMKAAQIIVIGSPVYWHNICGSVRDLLDRFYGPVTQDELSGRKLFFLFQGAAPEKWMLEAGEYTMERFAGLYGMRYAGMATDRKQAKELAKALK
ncbi:MAG: NAD(P)H-dependent oxidoreductase [Clostridiales bacterium]|nr:NAD(P)H-dependent oxidoreductase [Clostridiales bacterium]